MKIEVFLKSNNGPVSVGEYEVTEDVAKQIVEDFTKSDKAAGAYSATRWYSNSAARYQTTLILNFREVAHIG